MDALVYKAVNKARIALTHGEKTFVVVDENKLLYHTTSRGLSPVLDILDERPAFLENAIVGDKIVGRAAALLFLYAKVKAVYGYYISDEAIDLLQDNNCITTWKETVPYIVEKDLTSRYKLDLCLSDVTDPVAAVAKIREYLSEESFAG